MNSKKLIIGAMITASLIGFGSLNLSASNSQDYKMSKNECAHFIKISREAIDNDNLPLAQAYAKKAIQANSWDKLAWANYNDIVQKIADNGDVPDFGTILEESEAANAPTAGAGGSKFEGC